MRKRTESWRADTLRTFAAIAKFLPAPRTTKTPAVQMAAGKTMYSISIKQFCQLYPYCLKSFVEDAPNRPEKNPTGSC